MHLIGQSHVMLHTKGIVRIQTDIRVGSRYIGTYKALGSYESSQVTGRTKSNSSARR